MALKICSQCGKNFDREPIVIGGKELFADAPCDECGEANQNKFAAQQAEDRRQAAFNAWSIVCPPLYRETDFNRLPAKYQAVVKNWKFGWKGIGLVGQAGTMKTRTAFQILERHHFEGISCEAVSAQRFSRICVDQFSDSRELKKAASERLAKFGTVQILLIDDIGKGKMTDRAEMELFDLLETRTSHKLPTIWTANAKGDDLLRMMSEDRGEPIIRRLSEFSEIV
jgi:DNA replication protein DnaC